MSAISNRFFMSWKRFIIDMCGFISGFWSNYNLCGQLIAGGFFGSFC